MRSLRFFAVLMLAVTATSAQAMDHRSQFGVGAGLGANFAAPWAKSEFRDLVGPKVPAGGVWARYIPGTPEVGFGLSYNYIALSKMGFHAHTVIAEFFSRQNPWGSFHPFYGFGVGYARTTNKFAGGEAGQLDDPIYKLTAGIEFELDEHTDVGLRIDHYTIFPDTGRLSMHILTPVVTINHYFGSPAPMPAPEKPTPAPAPAPVAAPATPAVTAPALPTAETHEKAVEKKAPEKKSQQAAKKKKKRKKKMLGTGTKQEDVVR